jgi:uncharacterized membrane protein
MDRLIGQRLVESAEPTPQSSLSHPNPSSLRRGARHYVTMTTPVPELQQIANPKRAHLMGAGLLGMGVLHFVAPKPFDTIIPEELPGSARFYTYASGVAELGVGGLLLAPKTRRLGALAAVALFIGVLPGNINMCRLWFKDPDKSLPMRIGAIARLPLQIPMITEALKIYRSSKPR